MSRRTGSVAAVLFLGLAAVSPAAAQILVTGKTYETLKVEIESLRDDITLYQGDPQDLLRMEVRPNRFRPRVDYFDQSDATLKIRDLYVFDHADYTSKTPAERDADPPLAEEWEIRLSPTGPTDFAIRCERGKHELDFSNMEVERVSLRADESRVAVDFDGANPIQLERFAARVIGGWLRFRHLMNARAKEISLDLPNTECELEIDGKSFEGESVVTLLGTPASVKVVVSKKVALRVTGNAAAVERFSAPHMAQSGAERVSQGYTEAKGQVRLVFGSEVPKLAVEWK